MRVKKLKMAYLVQRSTTEQVQDREEPMREKREEDSENLRRKTREKEGDDEEVLRAEEKKQTITELPVVYLRPLQKKKKLQEA